MKTLKRIILLNLIFFLFLIPNAASLQGNDVLDNNQEEVASEEKTKVIYFYRESCPHCRNVKPLIEKVREENKGFIDFYQYEVTKNKDNINLFLKFLNEYNIPVREGKVPAIFIGDHVFIGDTIIFEQFENIVLQSKTDPLKLKNDLDNIIDENRKISNEGIEERSKLSLGLVIGAGIIDSINPCAIGVLLFLIAFLIAIKGSKKRIFIVGSTYIFAVFLTYLFAGLGLLAIINIYDIGYWVKIIAGVILIIAGLISIKDFFWYGKGISLKIPDKAKPVIEKYLTRATIPAVLIAGFLVSAFELPCTGEVYLGILSLIAENGEKTLGYVYLVLYNIIFVLPLIIILVLSIFGINIQRIKNVQSARKKWVRLFVGLGMIALGLFLIL